MKKILFFSTIYPRAYDPTRGIYCHHLCRELAADNQVRVISPRSLVEALTRPSPRSNSTDPVQVEYPRYFHPPGLLHSWSAEFMWASLSRTIRRVVKEFRPDCVLSYWAHPDGEVAVRTASLAGVPAGIIVGGSDVLLLPRNPQRGRAIKRALIRADAVFAVSRDLRERTIDLGVDPANVYVVYQGVDSRFSPDVRFEARDRLGVPQDTRLLIWVGRMDPVKGLEVLVEACAQLRDNGVTFCLVLIGNGPTRSTVEADVRRHGLVEHVRFAGVVSHDQLPDWYRAADLTVLSSHSEGIPNVLRESLACGIPYVATRVGGIHELCDNPAVRLVPPGNPTAFAEAIDSALKHPLPLQTTRIGTWRESAEQVLDLLLPNRVYEDLASSSPGDEG